MNLSETCARISVPDPTIARQRPIRSVTSAPPRASQTKRVSLSSRSSTPSRITVPP